MSLPNDLGIFFWALGAILRREEKSHISIGKIVTLRKCDPALESFNNTGNK